MDKAGGKILILGMGNPLLTDDTVGHIVTAELKKKYSAKKNHITFSHNYSGGFDMLYDLIGFNRAIIIDSINTGAAEPGFCHRFDISEINSSKLEEVVNTHTVNLPALIKIGVKCGYNLPGDIVLFGIEGRQFTCFSVKPTSQVMRGVHMAVKKIDKEIKVLERAEGHV